MSQKRKPIQVAESYIHRVAPLSQEPVTVMSIWSLVQVSWASGERTRHLVGRANREGRVCSDIVAFDLDSMTATTRSGRQYRLQGEPGRNRDAWFVFEVWLGRQKPIHVVDMTEALMRLRQQRGLPPDWSTSQAGPPATKPARKTASRKSAR